MKLDVGMLTHDLKSIPEYARKVEALGYDCLWSAETQHDPFLPLAVAATVTSRINLGTSIAVAFPRSPMILAHICWDLAKASGGRFILGLGSQVKGHNERRFSVKFESPAPKMREIVLALRRIWDCWQNGTKLDFKGTFYRFDLMTPFFNPGPIEHPAIPVYVAGVNAAMCRVAGEVCEGLHVHPFHSADYLRHNQIPNVAEGARRGGRTLDAVTFETPVMTAVGDTAEEIAATHGVDVVILGNNDLSSFSGWSQNDPRYQDAIIKVHNAALKYGKYYGNAGSQYLNGYTVTAGTHFVQNGPARDGWTPPRGGGGARGAAPAAGRGRGAAPEPDEEPVIGLPGGAPAAPRGRGNP